MAEWLKYQRRVALRIPGLDRISHEEHKRVFEAIAPRNPDAAETAMREHLLQGEQAYWLEAGQGEAIDEEAVIGES
ncbi:FCD domain-containing protein [Chelativorans xinjiangense]|uniref:FCD domain-containing protein n=1 Tax=Chelativorans xinjiangense TaxID=2681485 RepID=UPI001359D7CD